LKGGQGRSPFSIPACNTNQPNKGINVGTTEKGIGRKGDACADLVAEATSVLDSARRLFADLAKALEAELDQLQFEEGTNWDKKRLEAVQNLIFMNQKALQSVVNIRAKLLSQMDLNNLKAGLIDIDKARAEITRQLARLAA